MGDLYRALHDGLSRRSDQVGTTQSNVTYRWRLPSGGRAALLSVHPKASGPQPGLIADIRVEDLARQLGLAPEDLRAALPEKLPAKKIPGLYLYDEGMRSGAWRRWSGPWVGASRPGVSSRDSARGSYAKHLACDTIPVEGPT